MAVYSLREAVVGVQEDMMVGVLGILWCVGVCGCGEDGGSVEVVEGVGTVASMRTLVPDWSPQNNKDKRK